MPKTRVICFVGLAGSGKDTAANYILKNIKGLESFKWAETLKDIACLVYGWDRARLDDDLDYKEAVPFNDDGTPQCPGPSDLIFAEPLTRRQVLQQLGTDCFRKMFADDTWLRAAHRRITEIQEFCADNADNHPVAEIRGWVNADTRFPNEAEYVREHFDAHIIRVVRVGATQGTESSQHASETMMNHIVEDFRLEVADGDISGLQMRALAEANRFFSSDDV